MKGINVTKANERQALPTHVGTVPLEFMSGDEVPHNTGAHLIGSAQKHVRIVYLADSVLYSLQGGKQLVFCASRGGDTYFAGEDERAFATGITGEAFDVLKRSGENAFYAYLKPPIIAALEKRTERKALRQGDVWAMPLGITLNDLVPPNVMAVKILKADNYYNLSFDKEYGVLSLTGHWVNGCYFTDGESNILHGWFPRMNPKLIGETGTYDIVCGMLEAEDHKPLDLSKEFYLLAQTRGLVEDED